MTTTEQAQSHWNAAAGMHERRLRGLVTATGANVTDSADPTASFDVHHPGADTILRVVVTADAISVARVLPRRGRIMGAAQFRGLALDITAAAIVAMAKEL
ncbi:hypothetical protein [Phycicoccus sp.]|uniref:hypothetical protein n=1 Tax=Phycicoccus sp. TaxID=1902410 RepID=UPI002C61B2D4|nr:hypothetical protein [Phycicoccus sp.]HMM95372.1 hypothetical protein [Phycicoccus sp.]